MAKVSCRWPRVEGNSFEHWFQGNESAYPGLMHHPPQFLKLSRASRICCPLHPVPGVRSGITDDMGLSQGPVEKEIWNLPPLKMLRKKGFDFLCDCYLLLSLITKILSYQDEIQLNADTLSTCFRRRPLGVGDKMLDVNGRVVHWKA